MWEGKRNKKRELERKDGKKATEWGTCSKCLMEIDALSHGRTVPPLHQRPSSVKIIKVDNDLNEDRVVLDVGVVLSVQCRQWHEQRTAACNVHLRGRAFERRAGWVRSKCVDDVLTSIMINYHQCHLLYTINNNRVHCNTNLGFVQDM